MKRRSSKAARKTAEKQIAVCSASAVTTASTSQAASCSSSVTAAAGTASGSSGSGRQRRFTAKRALEMLQNLADTDSGSDVESQRNEDSESSVQLS